MPGSAHHIVGLVTSPSTGFLLSMNNIMSNTPPLQRTAWMAVILLWPVALLNYLDRQIFATMKSSILADVPDIVSNERFGELMTIFLLVYGLCSPIGGYVADRFNRRWVIIGSLTLWSLVTWVTGHMKTYDQLWWARAAMGLSEAFYIPAGLALIGDFHGSGTRSRAVGLHQSGIYLGMICGGMGGYIADSSYGWRSGFTWCGLAGICYAVVLVFLLNNPPISSETKSDEESKEKIRILPTIKALLGCGAFLILVLYFTLPGMPGWVVKSWMPSLLADTFHLTQGKAGLSATLWVTLASLSGVLVGGILADRWMRKTERGRIYVSAIGMFLCIPALFGIGYAPTLEVAVGFLILFGLGWGFFDTNNMPILCQIVPRQLRATGYGLMNFVSITFGGLAVKKVGAMRDSGTEPSIIFSICAVAALISVVLVLLIKPRSAQSSSFPPSN